MKNLVPALMVNIWIEANGNIGGAFRILADPGNWDAVQVLKDPIYTGVV